MSRLASYEYQQQPQRFISLSHSNILSCWVLQNHDFLAFYWTRRVLLVPKSLPPSVVAIYHRPSCVRRALHASLFSSTYSLFVSISEESVARCCCRFPTYAHTPASLSVLGTSPPLQDKFECVPLRDMQKQGIAKFMAKKEVSCGGFPAFVVGFRITVCFVRNWVEQRRSPLFEGR